MGRKLLLVLLPLLLVMLACSLPGFSPAPATEPPPLPGGGITPETGVTPEVVLPPPAVAPPLQVVYARAGNIWLWSEGALPIQLTSSGTDRSPRIRSDGLAVAFFRGEELWVANLDGTDQRAVVSSSFLASIVDTTSGGLSAGIQWFQWDPLFGTIFFGTNSTGEAYTIPVFDIWLAALDGITPPVLIESPGNGGLVTFSPDGQLYTMAQATKIVLKNREASIYRDALTFGLVQTYSEWFYIPEVVWFADSSEFRTVIPAHDALGDPFEGTYFWSVPVSGVPVEMAGFIASPAFMDFPRISPDGLTVAYMSTNGANTDLYLNGFYIGNELYTSYPAGQWGLVGWAPDSTRFVYWIDDTRTLWIGSLGSAAVPLTDTLHTQDLRFIDSSRILFLSDGGLRLGTAGGSSTLIDTGVDGGYDFYGFLP
jgi:hypothetical protein